MSEVMSGVTLFAVVLMAAVYILYFVYLYRYMRLLKTQDDALWHSFRASAGPFETPIYTAYRILRRNSKSNAANQSQEIYAASRMAIIFMYSGIVLFLVTVVLLLILDSIVS